MTEKDWLQVVRELAQRYAWSAYHTHDSRRSEPGFPDLVLAGHGRVLMVELKTDRGRISPAQSHWLDLLGAGGLEVGVWRPRDLPRVLLVLGPRQETLEGWTG